MNTSKYLEGKSGEGYKFFGYHKKDKGYIFRLLAVNAKEVYIQGDFNNWEKDKLRRYNTGVFSISIKNAKIGDRYQFILIDKDGNRLKKIDPFSRAINYEEDSSIIVDSFYKFKNKKINKDPINIYEVHLGSLLKESGKDYDSILDDLLNHVKSNNFTHILFMPLSEYQNYKTMGYASLGLFALSNRYGSYQDIKKFIDKCHKENIGVITELDISEFDPDSTYLSNFDGSRIYDYDYDDIRYNYNMSMNFDPTKNIAKSYILSAIDYRIDEFNLDGISFSAIENMIYRQGDKNRGENDDWISFIDDINYYIHRKDAFSIGNFNGYYDLDLSFDYIFDNSFRQISNIFKENPFNRDKYRKKVNNLLNDNYKNHIFGFNYVDSILNEATIAMKMYSDDKKLPQLKTLYSFLYTLNSQKLIFMGNEVADTMTWSIYNYVNFLDLEKDSLKFNLFFKDLSKIFLDNEVLNNKNSKTINLDIEGYSIYSYIREYEDKKLLIITNFTDIDYSINNPYDLVELINTEDLKYGGSGNINGNLEKGEKIKILPFNSTIFEIKNV